MGKKGNDKPYHTEEWMTKVFRKFDADLYRTKMIRPNFEDAYRKTSEDNRLIHGIKKNDEK